jgi:putative phage-type endonuclease
MSVATMNVCDCGGQGTKEWFEQRLGCLTASRIGDALTKKRNGESSQKRMDLILELAVERITGKPAEHFTSVWMERGIELEPLARAAFEMKTSQEVAQVDLVFHESIRWAACSPDGITGESVLEIKVPKPTTHAEYLLGECVPAEYVPQISWQLACTGLKSAWFASYCPDFKPPLDLFICRMERDEQVIAAMEQEARKFLEDVEATVIRLNGGLEGTLRDSLKAKG